MLTTHIDIEIYKDAKKNAQKLCNKNFKEAFEFVDFIKFLTTGTNLTLYGVKENDIDAINLIHDDLFSGKDESKRPQKNKNSFIEENIEIDDLKPYQLFFLNCEDEENIHGKINHTTFIIGFSNNYTDVFKQFNSDYTFRVGDFYARNKFINWVKTLPELPVTDLIINDPYLFDEIEIKDKTGAKKKINPFDKNAIVLFESLKNKYNHLKRVLIFTYIDWKKYGCEKDDFDCTEEARIELENKVKEIFGKSIQVDLIGNTREHDRYIFSNYFCINIGSSMNVLFDENGKRSYKNTSSMRVMSYTNNSSFFNATTILNVLFHQPERKKQKVVNHLFNHKY